MPRTYVWTIAIEIDAIEVEKHLTVDEALCFNAATAYDMVAEGLLPNSPGGTFRVKSMKLRKPDTSSLVYALQFCDNSEYPRLALVK